VLAILLPQAALAGEWYRCRGDSRVRQSCCCPPASECEARREAAELRRTACCDLLRVEPRALQARTEPTSSRTHAPVPLALPSRPADLGAGEARVLGLAARAAAPPLRSQPLFLRHASLLL
jgi:hypothetical protein